MSASRCLHLSMAIVQTPIDTWAEQLAAIPKGCPHDDCGEPRCCNTKNTEYCRVQYKILRNPRLRAPKAAA